MPIPASARKILLTAHVSSSVGWFGAVAGFLALAIVGLTSGNGSLAWGAYLAMDLTTWYVIVPLAVLSVLTGVISSLGTMWGLFRHYWVLVKLLITLVCSVILAIHMRPIELLAAAATRARSIDASLHSAQAMMVYASGAALAALLVLTALSVFKPRGLTGLAI